MPLPPERLLGHLRQLVQRPAVEPETDAALLTSFARNRDETAFATLVTRHGSMVLQVCRGILRDAHGAEDAAQATWLVLARKAPRLRHPDRLAAWLHGTARQIALRARRQVERQQQRDHRAVQQTARTAAMEPLDVLSVRESLALLDEEVQRLPLVYRLPVLLCCLEGCTQEEAARQLGWSVGSVKGRLERGRRRLHARLVRRGLTLTAALSAVELVRVRASTNRPAWSINATVRGAVDFAAHGSVDRSCGRDQAVQMAEATLQGMSRLQTPFAGPGWKPGDARPARVPLD